MARTEASNPAAALTERYPGIRAASERLTAPLSIEDQVVQSMPDASPAKWHLAHTTWFFETFVLKAHDPAYRAFHPAFEYLFNSYYNAVGEQYPRPRRGLVTRPSVEDVLSYRRAVDDALRGRLESGALADNLLRVVEIGLHHEQQHQELLLMDVKHLFSCNPLFPAYRDDAAAADGTAASPLDWIPFPGGEIEIGHAGREFAYDNEMPRHRAVTAPFRFATRLVTNGEYLDFVEAGGYRRADLWLADGWTRVAEEGWSAPLYWVRRSGEWHEFTLGGLRPLDPGAPVCHVSFYEAEAFASWAGARLPTEDEWERVAADLPRTGNFVESGRLHPAPEGIRDLRPGPSQVFGDVWEWTRSAYGPYPGFRAPAGALGEYNGKFMCNQFVLRGGSCVTPADHIRPTYRNFFYPHQRWPFCGIRLAV